MAVGDSPLRVHDVAVCVFYGCDVEELQHALEDIGLLLVGAVGGGLFYFLCLTHSTVGVVLILAFRLG